MISFYIAVMMIWTCTVKAQDDDKSIIHKIGFDVRPSYVAPTSKFLKDDGYGNGLTLRKAALIIPLETGRKLVILGRRMFSKAPASPKFLPGYPSIMSGISEPHLVGIRMMITIITAIRSSVLRSMPISIWAFSSTRNYPVIATCLSGRI